MDPIRYIKLVNQTARNVTALSGKSYRDITAHVDTEKKVISGRTDRLTPYVIIGAILPTKFDIARTTKT